MHSSSYYRPHSSPYKAPSKSANTYEMFNNNRSRSNLHDICDETWPLDEVIEKIDIKSDSEDDLNYYRNQQQSRNSRQSPQQQYNLTNYSSRKYAFDSPNQTFSDRYSSNSNYNNNNKLWNNPRNYDFSPKYSAPIDTDKWYKVNTHGK